MHTNRDLFKQIQLFYKAFDLTQLVELCESRMFSKPNDINELIDFFDECDTILVNSNQFIFLIDLQEIRILYVSSSFSNHTGYSAEKMVSGGISMFIKKACIADAMIGAEILKQIFNHAKQKELKDKSHYIYTSHFRSLNSQGIYKWFLSRMVMLTQNKNEKPQLMLSIITAIDHFKADGAFSYTLSKFNQKINRYETLSKIQIPPEGLLNLSNTDLNILKLLSLGYDNAKIGLELGYTEHTVKDYRKKMLKKTWCSNTSELICFALRNQLIH
jgi:DNA-binding NarL/FixJ family response regulator